MMDLVYSTKGKHLSL